ncbi:hypothetical protein ACROYT_G016138 [Oculina patagonica]
MDKGGRLFQNIIRAATRLNRLQIRHKTHDMVAWKMSAPLKGTLSISIKSPYSVKVEAINPMEYIENEDLNVQAVKGHVYLETNGEEDLGPEVKTAFQKDIQYNVQSDLASSSGFLEVTCSEQRELQYPSRDVTLHFQIPANYSVDINVRDNANAEVRDLEGGPFEITTDQGTCHMKNLKGSRLEVMTNGGGIECNSQLLFEYGNLDTKKKGKIAVKKLQGNQFYVVTEHGDIDVGATYVLKAGLTSDSGHVKLGDIHGLTEVNVEDGNISIGSISGTLKGVTKSGNIDVSLSKHDDVTLKTKKGDISIKSLEESLCSELQVKSTSIEIDSNINVVIDQEDKQENFIVISGKLNPKEKTEAKTRTIKAEAKQGTVKLERKDWFSSLKFS